MQLHLGTYSTLSYEGYHHIQVNLPHEFRDKLTQRMRIMLKEQGNGLELCGLMVVNKMHFELFVIIIIASLTFDHVSDLR